MRRSYPCRDLDPLSVGTFAGPVVSRVESGVGSAWFFTLEDVVGEVTQGEGEPFRSAKHRTNGQAVPGVVAPASFPGGHGTVGGPSPAHHRGGSLAAIGTRPVAFA